jgi:hypothetical protein
MFMFQFKIFGVSIEIMCAQKMFAKLRSSSAGAKKQFESTTFRTRNLSLQGGDDQDDVLLRERSGVPRPAKAAALTETRDTRRFGRKDFLNDILKLALAKRL